MIEISPGTAAMVYLFLTLATLLGLWVYQHYKTKNYKILPPEQNLRVCEYCHFAYLKNAEKAITQCPQCQCYNQKNKD